MPITTPKIFNEWLRELPEIWELVNGKSEEKKNFIWEYVKNRDVFLTIPKNTTPEEYSIFEKQNAKIILAVKDKQTEPRNIDLFLEDLAQKYDLTKTSKKKT